MKRSLFISGLLFATCICFGQWNNYNIIFGEYPTLFDVHFVDSMNGWMVGNNSVGSNNHLIIYHSNDGGNTLEVQYESSTYGGYPSSIFFVNTTTGWAAGDGVILHTNDGGQTWNEQGAGISLNGGLDLFFIDEQTGWIAGSNVIKSTTDGGLTWNEQSFPSSSLNNIQFVDNQNGFAVGWYAGGSGWQNGILLKTNNGGISWYETVINDIRLEDVFFVSENTGFIIGLEFDGVAIRDPVILKTTDGGLNWSEQYSKDNENSWDMNIFFTDGLHGWASFGWLSSNSTILYTNDGGDNWIERNDIVTLEGVNSIFFSDMQHGFMVGEEGHFSRTQNAGEKWSIKGFFDKPIESVSFSDALHGTALIGRFIISGYAYYLIKTDDGGENWTIIGPPENTDPSQSMHIFMHDSLHITMVPKGQGTSIYQSVNGGYLWDTISLIGNDNDWHCGRFINSDTGWVTRTDYDLGTSVLRTYDGGNNWEEFEMSTNDYAINAVFFFPASENSGFGCAVGTNVIFITTDFGETWLQTDWGVPLNDVFFTDETNGWVVGGNGIVLHSTDAGQNWIFQDAGTDAGLKSVWFTDDETGWIAGNNGTILYTSNGGNNWELSPCTVEESLNSVCFIDEQTGWIGGVGALLSYDGIWTHVYENNDNGDVVGCKIFPNPFNDKLTIKETESIKKIRKIEIYNSNGTLVSVPSSEKNSNGILVNLGHLPTGTYLIQIFTDDKSFSRKIIKY